MSRVQVSEGFPALLALLLLADTGELLPSLFVAAVAHEIGHLAVLYVAGGRLQALRLTFCGAALRCRLPEGGAAKAAVCLAGPAASLALTLIAAGQGGFLLGGVSALLGLFNLLPLPPLDGGMALEHLCAGRFTVLRHGLALSAAAIVLLGGLLAWQNGHGIWLLLCGGTVCARGLASLRVSV